MRNSPFHQNIANIPSWELYSAYCINHNIIINSYSNSKHYAVIPRWKLYFAKCINQISFETPNSKLVNQNIAVYPQFETLLQYIYSSHCNNSKHFAKLTFLLEYRGHPYSWKLFVFLTLQQFSTFCETHLSARNHCPSLTGSFVWYSSHCIFQYILRNSPFCQNIAAHPYCWKLLVFLTLQQFKTF